jgi:hypothetical protein
MIDKKKIQCQIRRLVKRKSSVKSESKQSSSVVEAQEKKNGVPVLTGMG